MINIMRLPPGANLTGELVDNHGEALQELQDLAITRVEAPLTLNFGVLSAQIPDRDFWAVITCCGPHDFAHLDEGPDCTLRPDYKDNRYWFKSGFISNTGAVGDGQAVVVTPYGDGEPGQIWDTATNLFESGDESHFVRPGTPVLVHVVYDKSGTPRYLLEVADESTARAPCGSSSSSSSSGSETSGSSSTESSGSASGSESGSGSASGSGSTTRRCWYMWRIKYHCDTGVFDPIEYLAFATVCSASNPFPLSPIGVWNIEENAETYCTWTFLAEDTTGSCELSAGCTNQAAFQPTIRPNLSDCSCGGSGSGSGSASGTGSAASGSGSTGGSSGSTGGSTGGGSTGSSTGGSTGGSGSPPCPSGDGTYVLTCTVSGGVCSYAWSLVGNC